MKKSHLPLGGKVLYPSKNIIVILIVLCKQSKICNGDTGKFSQILNFKTHIFLYINSYVKLKVVSQLCHCLQNRGLREICMKGMGRT